jgi:hypothetical protein
MAREERVKEKVEESGPKSKADAIRASKMPDWQKEQYLKDIGETKSEEVFDPKKVSFPVYATVRKVPVDKRKAMLVYPKAVGVKAATLEEWDEIYKQF